MYISIFPVDDGRLFSEKTLDLFHLSIKELANLGD